MYALSGVILRGDGDNARHELSRAMDPRIVAGAMADREGALLGFGEQAGSGVEVGREAVAVMPERKRAAGESDHIGDFARDVDSAGR
jgi:hypothetical protein